MGREQIEVTGDLANFSGIHFAAIEIRGFSPDISESVWIFLEGLGYNAKHFLDEHHDEHIIGCSLNRFGTIGEYSTYCDVRYAPPGVSSFKVKTPDSWQQWVTDLRERYTTNRLGGRADLPNVVFLESEARTLSKIEEEYSVIPEHETFHWLARYRPTTRREGSLQNYLFTLKAVHEEKYHQIVTTINGFFRDKKISGFHQATADLMITTKSGQTHPVHFLSSGEKQILLMIAFLVREFRPRGIILLDEPDLHLHVSMRNAFVSYLKRMIRDRHGQLILVSHAPELWQHFTQAQRVELWDRSTGTQENEQHVLAEVPYEREKVFQASRCANAE
jgi:predicted ATPase